MRKYRLLPPAVGLLAAVALLPAAPVAAHDNNSVCIVDGGIARGCGGVLVNHRLVWNIDNTADGRGTRTWYIYGDGVLDYVGDPDGLGGRRGEEIVPGGLQALWFQVCVGPIGAERCTSWSQP